MSSENRCPFCDRVDTGDISESLRTAASFADGFPISPGHTLIVPCRHEPDFFKLTDSERSDVWELVNVVQERLTRSLNPDGFNIGINIGAAAGQTVGHAHVHVIPRFEADVGDPRGGVRWVIPANANYWDRKLRTNRPDIDPSQR